MATYFFEGTIRRHLLALRYRRWTVKYLALAFAFLSFLGFGLISLYHVFFTIQILPWNPSVDNWCAYDDVPDYMIRPAPDEMTIVTMFLNLGTFKKGHGMFYYHSPYKYRSWMRSFGKMVNRVVAYIEDDGDIEYFKKVRSCLPPSLTKIIKIHRDELPAFSHLPQIRKIFSLPSYPKHEPDTTNAEYACTMHAKFDVIERALIMDFFQTPYFAWLDLGLFRDLISYDQPLFKLVPPDKFNPERIGMSQAFPLDPVQTPEFIMKNTQIWVSGGMILAEKEYMMNFTKRYKEVMNELLNDGLVNTDQTTIYAMYSVKMRKPKQVKIKTYLCHQGQLGLWGSDSRYFCLGYVCKNAWEKRVPNLSQSSDEQLQKPRR